MEKMVRRDCKERDNVQECVRMMMWMWCAREGGGEARTVGGSFVVVGRVETRGTGGGGCVCR